MSMLDSESRMNDRCCCKYGRRSVGDGGAEGTRPPRFSVGDNIGIVHPTFQFRKIARHTS